MARRRLPGAERPGESRNEAPPARTGRGDSVRVLDPRCGCRAPPERGSFSRDRLGASRPRHRRIGSTAVMVVHRGAVVAQWGDTAAKTPLASVRKSLLSALIGQAVERGQINLSQSIGALGIDDNEPSLTVEEKTATVRDLLHARSGIYHPALYET